MTADEKRQEKAMLLLSLEEAREEFAVVREKCRRVGEAIEHIGRLLKTDPPGARVTRVSAAAVPLDDPQVSAILDRDALLALIGEFDAAKQRLAEMEQRKREIDMG